MLRNRVDIVKNEDLCEGILGTFDVVIISDMMYNDMIRCVRYNDVGIHELEQKFPLGRLFGSK